jgi:hypothetical protein
MDKVFYLGDRSGTDTGHPVTQILNIKRIVFLDFIHRLVSQEQTKLKIMIDKR